MTVLDISDVKARPRHPEKARLPDTPVLPKPAWIRVRAPGALRRIQAGLGRTGVSGSRAFSGWRGRVFSTSDLSSTVTID